jgi:hypothetical protein
VGVAFAALLGLATTEPAAAWDDGRNYKGTDIYVHHYVHNPPRRIRHVYHMLPSGPYHAHFVHYDTTSIAVRPTGIGAVPVAGADSPEAAAAYPHACMRRIVPRCSATAAAFETLRLASGPSVAMRASRSQLSRVS